MRLIDAGARRGARRVYREHNEPLHDELEACAGDRATCSSGCTAEGRRLGIVTAKRRATVELAFARAAARARCFEVVVGADDTERHKPDPEPLLLALERLGARPAEAAYVGDSPFDVQAAQAAGVLRDRRHAGAASTCASG